MIKRFLLTRPFFTLCLFFFPSVTMLGQNTGVGTPNPSHTLHIKPLEANPVKDPLRVENLQEYVTHSDSMILVVDPDSGVLRVMHVDSLLNQVNQSSSSLTQDADKVLLTPTIDVDGDNNNEQNVQQAIQALTASLPKGTYKSIGEARSAGLEDGDSFWAHPNGVLGCSGCVIKLIPGMN